MKPKPTLKQKKRYLVFEAISKETFTLPEIKTAVKNAFLQFLGELGTAQVAPLFIKLKGNKFIVKVNHKFVDQAISSLILIKRIKNKPVILRSIITSGTLKKASLSL